MYPEVKSLIGRIESIKDRLARLRDQPREEQLQSKKPGFFEKPGFSETYAPSARDARGDCDGRLRQNATSESACEPEPVNGKAIAALAGPATWATGQSSATDTKTDEPARRRNGHSPPLLVGSQAKTATLLKPVHAPEVSTLKVSGGTDRITRSPAGPHPDTLALRRRTHDLVQKLDETAHQQPDTGLPPDLGGLTLDQCRTMAKVALQSLDAPLTETAQRKSTHDGVRAILSIIERETDHIQACQKRIRWQKLITGALDEVFAEVILGRIPSVEDVYLIGQSIVDDLHENPHRVLDLPYFPAAAGYVVSHSLNVARLATYMALQHDRWRERADDVAVAGLLHDVGMTQLDDDFVQDARPLIPAERLILEEHPYDSQFISEQIAELPHDIARAVGQHHERLDGSGYPDRLQSVSIIDLAQILAIADCFESMVSPRPYRQPRLPREAMGKILLEAERGRLDQTWVQRFLNLSYYPVGSYVELSTGEIAKVVAANPIDGNHRYACRPIVQVLIDADGKPTRSTCVLNLAHYADLHIADAVNPARVAECLHDDG